MKKSRNPFTLIEILICLFILGLASSVIGLQIRAMVADHTFSNNIENLVATLKKCQLIAACDQTDIDIVIAREGKHCAYWVETDDPLPSFFNKKMIMTGVERATFNEKPLDQAKIHFYPSGRLDEVTLHFFKQGEKIYTINLKPSIIELKLASP